MNDERHFSIANFYIFQSKILRNGAKESIGNKIGVFGAEKYFFKDKITDKKIDWAYGYYYNENISKAKQDFNKVLSGGNLANTFDKNKKDKER